MGAADDGVPFTVLDPMRSVLLYSYRPNPDEAADGTLTDEKLAVRVIDSRPVAPIVPDSALNPLGRRGLLLGGGSAAADGAVGIVTRGTGTGVPATISPAGPNLVLDFWLNAKGLKDIPVALTNCTTTTVAPGTTVTCSSTAGLAAGMSLSGSTIVPGTTIASITNATTFTLSAPAANAGTALALTAFNKPVKILTTSVLNTSAANLEVILDPATATLTARFMGRLSVSHPVSMAEAGWSHCVIHIFGETFFGVPGLFPGVPMTLLDFYVDGVRAEDGLATALFPTQPTASFNVSAGLTATSMRFGAGANRESMLQLDQVRLFDFGPINLDNTYLDQGEVRILREKRTTNLRGVAPLFYFDFEAAPSLATGASFRSFANSRTDVKIGVGPFSTNDPSGLWPSVWSRLDIQEVATRIDSALDNAGFNGGGYILNEISNYNASLYTRGATVGTWGPIFPVNEKRLFTDPLRLLEVAYYENPYRQDAISHPNVAWPYLEARYDEVIYPKYGPHRDKAIYIASRVGSEGIDQNGFLQQVFGLDQFANFKIYNQPARGAAGFNPNEEHAIAAASNRAALKLKEVGEDIPNNPPLAAFALQRDINVWDRSLPVATMNTYTSDPWVLVQVNNLGTGEPEMAAYKVEKVRSGKLDFPRPTLGKDRDGAAYDTTGLAYEPAANPEDRFLTMDPSLAYDFSYAADYPVMAGDLLIPPYPLNVVIGNVPMPARGSSDGDQRTLWKDVYNHAWVVSGGGSFFYQFFYPFRSDFYFTTPPDLGTPVAWMPDLDKSTNTFKFIDLDTDTLEPGKVHYSSSWRTTYPKLKRGETLTYQGGEYFNENPGSNGLPALVAMKAVEIVYDVSTPNMVFNESNLDAYSARIIRPLDRHEARFKVAQMKAAKFEPAAPSVFVVAERWYFKDLPGSLQRRFYFDSLAEKLVFRGYLNDKDSGNPNLTAGPDPVNVLEPGILTPEDFATLQGLAASEVGDDDPTKQAKQEMLDAITTIYEKTRNPMMVRAVTDPEHPVITGSYLAGIKESPLVTERIGLNLELLGPEADRAAELAKIQEQAKNLFLLNQAWDITALKESLETIQKADKDISELRYKISLLPTQPESIYVPLDSFGVGSALVPNPGLLTSAVNGSRFITIAENNREELNGAPVSLHIIEIIPDRYRGTIKVIEAADAFSERVTLQHNGEFGANTGDLYYEWWIRDARPLDTVLKREIDSLSTATPDPNWQQYTPEPKVPKTPEDLFALKQKAGGRTISAAEAKHFGLHSIVFEGRPDVVLADKLVLMRYRHITETDWKLVPFEFASAATEWKPGTPAPFQWAGAANSPQLQADGSKRYIPQLVMGWVKRVLDRINPYEARYNDFFSNESPATYSSQIRIAGGPFAGKVALNPDKNVIENTGLIELYETVLARARELSIDNSSNGNASEGIKQALLLAATRLSVLYELLAREAYSDAQDSTITVGHDDGLASVAPYTFAFQNMEADVMHEELALLRGTDFRKSYPVYNRMFWNYAKGLGEAAYNVNYNIYDANTDGFINEDDARKLYPQGHGDSWGHYLSAIGMHYTLLQHPNFSWLARSELYSLMQNVLEVDYLDEKTFAKLAAGKARAGRDIVRGTYRMNYTQNPDGQWQGYTDSADPARAWGVSEWAHRAEQGAYFDWIVANALLPADSDPDPSTPVGDPENLDRIERSGAIAEIGEIAAGMFEIQTAMDEANGGVNPLGFDSDAVTFDLDPAAFDGGSSHFEQVYDKALAASSNALATLDFAARADNKLRAIGNDTNDLIVEAFQQDLDYRNRLIEIFGRPYDGTIGFGKPYPEGYEGPDTLLFAYLDHTKISEIVPQSKAEDDDSTVHFYNVYKRTKAAADDPVMVGLYQNVWGAGGTDKLSTAFVTLVGDRNYELEAEMYDLSAGKLSLPYKTTAKYGFQAPTDWGQRTSYGKVQTALEGMLMDEIALDSAIADYIGFLQDWEQKTARLDSQLEIFSEKEGLRDKITAIRATFKGTFVATDAAITAFELFGLFTTSAVEVVAEAFPTDTGFSNDITAPIRAAALGVAAAAKAGPAVAKTVSEALQKVAEFVAEELIAAKERDLDRVDQLNDFEGMVEELTNLSGGDQPKRDAIGTALQSLEMHRQEYITAQAEGFRLLREREAFNKILAAKVQKHRYQDMVVRLSRNETMSKYQSAFNHAARYTWLAAKAYEYETSLDPGHPAAASGVLDKIVQERQLGLWADGAPLSGQGGLAEILNQLSGNFQVLKGQLGINNPQQQIEKISLRSELFRIGPAGTPSSDARWIDALKARKVNDLNQMPEFVRSCRPFATGAQPGLVIRFATSIEPGRNVFGQALAAGDHKYSTANFATKIRSFGVSLTSDYGDAGLSGTPRAYMVPIGNDYLRTSTSALPVTRMWSLVEQRIPTPFTINQSNLTSPGYIPTLNGVDGSFSDLRRHGDFRIFFGDPGGNTEESDVVDEGELIFDSRLIGRSVWNSEWMLVIPGAELHVDPNVGLTNFAETVSDIAIYFQTYSHQGE